MAKGNKGKARKVHGIENLGLAITAIFPDHKAPPTLHNADILNTESSATLSNPMDTIDALTARNSFWGNVALRVLCATIGYSAVNTILWDFRKRNMVPTITSGIDWLNDSLSEIKAKEDNEANFEEQGHDKLTFVNGHEMIGPYKYLFMLVTQNDDIRSIELPSPATLYNRMRQRDKDRVEVLAAYETFDMERFKDSPNFQYTKERLERNKKVNDERSMRKAQQEIDHIHNELASVRHEVFDENVWSRIPLHMQFRIMRSVHRQVIAAIANELEKPADERVNLDALNEMGEVLLLELEGAYRDPIVKLAFEKNILKLENHGLIPRA